MQYRLFRMKPTVEEYIQAVASRMHVGGNTAASLPAASSKSQPTDRNSTGLKSSPNSGDDDFDASLGSTETLLQSFGGGSSGDGAEGCVQGVGGFPFGLPMAGLHIRHGDKSTDGFREHSLKEALRIVKASGATAGNPDCAVANTRGHCFSVLNTSHHSAFVTVHRAVKHRIVVLDARDIERHNRTMFNQDISLDPKLLLRQAHAHLHAHVHHPTSATHTPKHQYATPLHQQHHSHNHSNTTELSLPAPTYVLPTGYFVASDDSSVLLTAASKGLLTSLPPQSSARIQTPTSSSDPIRDGAVGTANKSAGPAGMGVSQQTSAADGMLKTLLSHPELANSAALEIITDIYFLSQCSTLVGMAASQVFRMAVAMANVTGTLRHAAILDADQLGRVQQMSRQYNIPFPEHFYT